MQDYTGDLGSIASQVLETTAFALVDPCSADELQMHEDGVASRIKFAGQVTGDLTIVAPRELCVTLAANILALEPDEVDDAMAADTLGEMANVICGHWITSVCGKQPVVQLDIPRSSVVKQEDWAQHLSSRSSTCLLVEDLPLVLDLQLSQA